MGLSCCHDCLENKNSSFEFIQNYNYNDNYFNAHNYNYNKNNTYNNKTNYNTNNYNANINSNYNNNNNIKKKAIDYLSISKEFLIKACNVPKSMLSWWLENR